MKKFVALFMALALVLSCTAAFAKNERQAYKWSEALPENATFMFDYSYMQPVQAVKMDRGLELPALQHTNSKDETLYLVDGKPVELTDDEGHTIYDDFAHMSKAEVAYYNEQGDLDATFIPGERTKSTPYGIKVEYAYSQTAPWDLDETTVKDIYPGANLSNIAPTWNYDEEKGWEYVDKTVSNTPAANVATTLNKTNNYISTAFVAGYLKSELNSEASKSETQNVVPVDLSADGTYVYPIVTKAHTIVGLVWATVAEGTVTIDGQLRDQVNRYGDDFTLKIYTTTAQLAKSGTAFEIGTEISIADELGGASAIFFEITGKVQYHWAIGASKVGTKSVYWTLQDYWRNEIKWKIYRNGLKDIAALVAAE